MRKQKRQDSFLPFFIDAYRMRWLHFLRISLFSISTLLPVGAGLAQSAGQPPLPTQPLRAGMYIIQAEIAATHEQRQMGLMFRQKLAPNGGMLFVFDEQAPHCMWMRNTLIPLSVAFIDDDGVIVNIEDMQPRTEIPHCARRPVRYALEMQQGWFAKRGIQPGLRLTLNPKR